MSESKETIELVLSATVTSSYLSDVPDTVDYILVDPDSGAHLVLTEAELSHRIKHINCEEISYRTFPEYHLTPEASQRINTIVLNALAENPHIKRVSHPLNPMMEVLSFSKPAVSAFIHLLNNPNITHIDLFNMELTAEITSALAKRLRSPYPLISLKLRLEELPKGTKPLVQDYSEDFFQALAETQTLQSLNLRGQNLTPKTVLSLARALEKNKSIQHLYVFGEGSPCVTHFDPESAKAFAEMLAKNSTLLTLGLGDSNFANDPDDSIVSSPSTELCFDILMQGMIRNKSIRDLTMGNDYFDHLNYEEGVSNVITFNISDAMSKSLIKLIRENTILRRLFFYIQLEDQHLPGMRHALRQNKSLQYHQLLFASYSNPIDKDKEKYRCWKFADTFNSKKSKPAPAAGDSKSDSEGDWIMRQADPLKEDVSKSASSSSSGSAAFHYGNGSASSSSAASALMTLQYSASPSMPSVLRSASSSASSAAQEDISEDKKRKAPSDNGDGKSDRENPSQSKKARTT